MIIEGSKGSMVLFYKDVLICGFPLGKNTYEDYKKQSDDLILDSLRKNKSIQEQIILYKTFIQTIYKRKINNKKISGYDLQVFSSCILALIKFNIFDIDDIVFIAGKKRNRKNIKVFNQLPYSSRSCIHSPFH